MPLIWSQCWRMILAGIGIVIFNGVRAGTLTIATYNIENYTLAHRVTDEGFRKDYPKPEAAKQALRRVIRDLGADVLLLQEMGAKLFLDELRRDLAADGVIYPHGEVLDGPDADRRLAVLSRVPLKAVVRHPEVRFKYFDGTEVVKRGALEVRIGSSTGDLTLWTLHLKSRFTDRSDDPRSARRRGAEATALRDLILRRAGDPAVARLVIAGDFNDSKASAAVRYLTRKGGTIISELLPAADSRGEAWTYFYRQEDSYARVDHILVSPALLPSVQGGAARIHDGPGNLAASDHRAVSVTLSFDPAP